MRNPDEIIRQLRAEGLGWEDIDVRLKAAGFYGWGLTVKRLVLDAQRSTRKTAP